MSLRQLINSLQAGCLAFSNRIVQAVAAEIWRKETDIRSEPSEISQENDFYGTRRRHGDRERTRSV